MFKIDLGISHNVRDAYFNNFLLACQKELEEKKIILDLTLIEDIMLLSDYASWNYRNRTENVELAKNLQLRIRNRIMRERALYVEPTE
jgi:hypothetical protein